MTPQEFQRRFGEAAQAFQSERFVESERLAKRLLMAAPDQQDLLHLLGLSLFKQGRGTEARDPLRKAARGGNLSYVRTLAIVLRETGDRKEAISTIEIVGGGRGPMAGLLGILYLEEDRLEDAAAALGSAVAQNSNDAEAHINLGIAHERLGRLSRAEAAFTKALTLTPDHIGVRVLLARVLLDSGKAEDAHATLQLVVRDPAPDIQSLAGAIAIELGDFDGAREYLQVALDGDPDHVGAATNLALLDLALGEWESARDRLNDLCQKKPEDGTAALHLAHVLRDLGEMDKARTTIETLIAREPKNHNAIFERAHLTLMQGDLAKGLKDYESRWDVAERKSGRLPPKPTIGRTAWSGGRANKLYLLAEQGFGDTIMFSRFAALANSNADEVHLVCPPELEALLSASLVEITSVKAELPPTDAQAGEFELPIMSLPRKLELSDQDITSFAPWLRVPPTSQDKWSSKLATLKGFKVGLVWSGNPDFVRQGRWLTFDQLAPLFGVNGIDWVSLQMGPARDEIASAPSGFHDWADDIDTFGDTAGIVDGLDLVITADTSVSHVAGGLGKPFWLLNRFQSEWRWQRGRTDSPWYPTARLFNQPSRGDWTSVIASVAKDLPDLI